MSTRDEEILNTYLSLGRIKMGPIKKGEEIDKFLNKLSPEEKVTLYHLLTNRTIKN